MFSASEYRLRYGEVFLAELPDGTIVPWVPLSLSDFIKYDQAFRRNLIAPAVLENEIFVKCVRDTFLVENIGKLKAGTVTTIASTILRQSAPVDEGEFTFLLNESRGKMQHVLHQAVAAILQAFPGYTPDDIYAMNIYDISDRLALAESKLLQTGMIKEPFAFFAAAEEKKQNPRQKKPKVDLTKVKELYDKQSGLKPMTKPEPMTKPMEPTGETTVISSAEMIHNMDTDPTNDTPVQAQMMESAKIVYKDYLEAMKKGKKVAIKSVDERIAEAKVRMEENRKKLAKKKGSKK